MTEPTNPRRDASRAASPLGRALAEQSEAQFTDLARARGLAGETFATLARRADRLLDRCADARDPDALDALAERRSVLRSVARLLEDPSATEIPPSNDAIYDAVLDVTELEAIVSSLRPATPTDRLLGHLIAADADAARRDRLALAFAAVCRRAGLAVALPAAPGGTVALEIDRWPFAAAPAVPLGDGDVGAACAAAESALRAEGRPGVVVLEVGAVLPADPLRVADDATAVSVMSERLDALMLGLRDRVLDACEAAGGSSPNAFGLVVRATMPATNVASRRLLFAECVRAVNLCETTDSRIHGFQAFADALARADRAKHA